MRPLTALYVAIGDSISIDDYPRYETGRDGLGAASLFLRNADDFWPEFQGRDLLTATPCIRFLDLTADGATTDDVLRWQLPRLEQSDDEAIVTITAGGNDLLMNLRAPKTPPGLVEGVSERIRTIVETVLQRLPAARVFLGTIYDPSDGTNILYGERLEREARWLAAVNDSIRNTARLHEAVTLIDIHRHFLGHGLTVAEKDRWYWSGLVFEPNARGASEVRRLWLEAL